MWLEVATAVAVLDWSLALDRAHRSVLASEAFWVKAQELADLTELTECLHMTPNGMNSLNNSVITLRNARNLIVVQSTLQV